MLKNGMDCFQFELLSFLQLKKKKCPGVQLLNHIVVAFLIFFLGGVILFIFGCAGSSLLCLGPLQLWQVRASRCSGFSVPEHGLQKVQYAGCQDPQHRLNRCGAPA